MSKTTGVLLLLSGLLLAPSLACAALTELEAQEAAKIVKSSMDPLLASQSLRARFRWGGDTVDVELHVEPDHKPDAFVINIHPGLYQRVAVDRNLFILAICHEYGHVLGGAPYMISSIFSSEGQADYFATRVCVPKVLAENPGLRLPAETAVPQVVDRLCDHEDACIFSSIIGAKLVAFLANPYGHTFQHGPWSPSYLEPSPIRPRATLQGRGQYPDLQCRLDTFMNGALNEERPPCWYVPANERKNQ